MENVSLVKFVGWWKRVRRIGFDEGKWVGALQRPRQLPLLPLRGEGSAADDPEPLLLLWWLTNEGKEKRVAQMGRIEHDGMGLQWPTPRFQLGFSCMWSEEFCLSFLLSIHHGWWTDIWNLLADKKDLEKKIFLLCKPCKKFHDKNVILSWKVSSSTVNLPLWTYEISYLLNLIHIINPLYGQLVNMTSWLKFPSVLKASWNTNMIDTTWLRFILST